MSCGARACWIARWKICPERLRRALAAASAVRLPRYSKALRASAGSARERAPRGPPIAWTRSLKQYQDNDSKNKKTMSCSPCLASWERLDGGLGRSRGGLGGVVGASWGLLGPLGATVEPLGANFGRLRPSWSQPGSVLGASWGALEAILVPLGGF